VIKRKERRNINILEYKNKEEKRINHPKYSREDKE